MYDEACHGHDKIKHFQIFQNKTHEMSCTTVIVGLSVGPRKVDEAILVRGQLADVFWVTSEQRTCKRDNVKTIFVDIVSDAISPVPDLSC